MFKERDATAAANMRLKFTKADELSADYRREEARIKAEARSPLGAMMQVCFVIDGTGSMASLIKQVRDNITRIAEDLRAKTAVRPSFGLVRQVQWRRWRRPRQCTFEVQRRVPWPNGRTRGHSH